MSLDLAPRLDRLAGRLPAKAAIVTGSGDTDDDEVGVGSAIATVLAAAGAPVLVLDRDAGNADRTVDRIRSRGGRAQAHLGDVRSSADCDGAARAALDAFGEIGVLVNNAAVLGTALTLDYADDELATTLDVNLSGALRMARACRHHLGHGSSIVNIGSLGALRTFGRIDYEAAKGALMTVTRTLAVELGPLGVRVNAVTPGQVWTPLGKRRLVEMGQTAADIERSRQARASGCPLRSEGTAWDVAFAVLFLASEEARWITAHSLVVDGGQSALVGWMPEPGH